MGADVKSAREGLNRVAHRSSCIQEADSVSDRDSSKGQRSSGARSGHARIGHDFVLGGFEEGEALLGRPTPPTLLGPPLRLKDRFAELCGERMTAATKAQSEASCRPSVAASRRAEVSQRWVWLTPALLLRKPRGSKTVDPEKPAALIKGCRGLRDPVIDAVRRRGRRGGSQAPLA